MRDLTALNYNTLPEKYRFLFDVARQRGFFESAGGGEGISGRYDLRCSKQSCRSNSQDRRTRQDPRGMSININEDGSQDEFEKAVKRDSSYKKAVGCCPVCGTLTMMETKENLFTCSECGQSFRLKETGKGYDQV